MKKFLLFFSMMSLFSIAMYADPFLISVSADPEEGGLVFIGDNPDNQGLTFEEGEWCTVHAENNEHFSFENWTVDGVEVSRDAIYSFQVSDNRTLVAHFTEELFQIEIIIDPIEGGTVDIEGSYTYGSTCTLHAVANDGYSFVKWTKNGVLLSTNPTMIITITGNATYVAHFQQNVTYYTIMATASPTNGGTVSGSGSYALGSACTLQAVPNSGYSFVKWTKNGTQVSTNPNYSFTVTGNATYVAHFQQNVTYYTITATASPTNGGTVSGSGSYASGSSCTLHAVANSGYSFVNWTLNGSQVSTNPNCSFTVIGNGNYIAHFEQNITYYTITTTASPVNGGTVTGGGSYASGSTCSLHAQPNLDYEFAKWMKGDEEVSTEVNYRFNVTESGDYTACFRKKFEIKTMVEPDNSGTITIDTLYYINDNEAFVTLTAVANDNSVFYHWTNNGVDSVLSTNSTESFMIEIETDTLFIAHFVRPEIVCSFSALNPCNREKCTYELTGVELGYDDYDYAWTTSDEQSVTVAQGNQANIQWGTDGNHTLLVKVFKKNNHTFTSWFERELTVNVHSNITSDEVQKEIIVKQKDGKPYLLIFPNKEEIEYYYQWFKDNEVMTGENKQYLYKNGGLDYGVYKVYISKDVDDKGSLICGAFSSDYQVYDDESLSSSIYPNPSHSGDIIVVKNDSDCDALLSIYTIDGKLLHNQIIANGFAEVSTKLPQGIYILRIANGQDVKVEKLVIQ